MRKAPSHCWCCGHLSSRPTPCLSFPPAPGRVWGALGSPCPSLRLPGRGSGVPRRPCCGRGAGAPSPLALQLLPLPPREHCLHLPRRQQLPQVPAASLGPPSCPRCPPHCLPAPSWGGWSSCRPPWHPGDVRDGLPRDTASCSLRGKGPWLERVQPPRDRVRPGPGCLRCLGTGGGGGGGGAAVPRRAAAAHAQAVPARVLR